MITQRLLKKSSHSENLPQASIPTQSNLQEILNRHLNRCYFKVGDKFSFKKPRNNPAKGVIKHIETDASKVVWNVAKTVPFYITVDTIQNTKNGVIEATNVRTYESKLRWSAK